MVKINILILIGLMLLGALLSLAWKPNGKTIHYLAKTYLLIAIYLMLSVWIYYFAGITNVFLKKSLAILLEYGSYLTHLILGYLAGNILIRLRDKDVNARLQLKADLNLALWGISASIGNAFIMETVGKLMGISYMIEFFKQSGYAIWFLYFIILAECLGGLGILLHFKFRKGPWPQVA